ncbi:MAG: hypothetical protein ABWX92_11985 [Mycetocola sp.]
MSDTLTHERGTSLLVQDAHVPVPATERTVAFFADRRAAPLLLTDTVDQIISNLHVQRGLVDLSSIPGLAIAAAFVRAGIPYETIEYGQERTYETLVDDHDSVQNPVSEADAERFRSLAAGEVTLDIAELGNIDANIALVPAVVGPNEKLIDFSPQTITGVVMSQAEDLGRNLILIDTPERGLTVEPSGEYLRTVLLVEGAGVAA